MISSTNGHSLGSDAPQGWKTPYVLALLIIGAFLIVAFVFWERWCAYPLVPMSIWRDRDFSLVITVLLLGFLAFPIMAFWIALFMQKIKNYSALLVAVHMLPMAIGGIIVNVIAGLIMHRVSNTLLMGVGATAYVASFLLMGLQHADSSYWAFIFPGLLLAVVGADFEFCVANMYVMSSLPPQQQSIAGGIFQTVTKLCVTIGMGISTAIFDAVAARGTATSGYFANDPIEPYAATFLYCAGIAAVGIPLCAFLKIGTQGHAGGEETSGAASESGLGAGSTDDGRGNASAESVVRDEDEGRGDGDKERQKEEV